MGKNEQRMERNLRFKLRSATLLMPFNTLSTMQAQCMGMQNLGSGLGVSVIYARQLKDLSNLSLARVVFNVVPFLD